MARFSTRAENLFKKETYITIEVVTKEDFEFVMERLENHNERKPLGVDLHGKKSGNIHKYVCPICGKFLNGRYIIEESKKDGSFKAYICKYCPECGQKLDWSDIE